MGFWNSEKKEDEDIKKSIENDEETEDDSEDEESDEETYEIDVECDNCTDNESYEIPCGTTVDDFLKDKKCEICGCLVRP